jgi:hypothetical protein
MARFLTEESGFDPTFVEEFRLGDQAFKRLQALLKTVEDWLVEAARAELRAKLS